MIKPPFSDTEVLVELLTGLGGALLDPVIVTTSNDTIVYWNERAEQCFGWAAGEAIGRTANDLLVPEPMKARHASAVAVLHNGGRIPGPRRFTARALRSSGSEFEVELSLTHILVGAQRLTLCFLRDLTNEKTLRSLENRLIHVSRRNALGTMASALAHELSQPIGAASNYLSAALLLSDKTGAVPPEVRSALDHCMTSLSRCNSLLQSIRNMVSRGRMVPAKQSLDEMIAEVATLLSARLPCAIEVDIHPNANWVHADRMMIEQLLLNLVRNAGEAQQGSRDPFIRVTAEQAGPYVLVCVEDGGPGIPIERRARLFEAFESTKAEGLGMGLAICAVLAERSGGKIWLDEEHPSGAKFCFTLPLETAGR